MGTSAVDMESGMKFGEWAAEIEAARIAEDGPQPELPALDPIAADYELEDLLKVRNAICTTCFVEKTSAGNCLCTE